MASSFSTNHLYLTARLNANEAATIRNPDFYRRRWAIESMFIDKIDMCAVAPVTVDSQVWVQLN